MPLAVPDLVGPDLRLLFCGINPGTLSGQLGLHFARSGNRFWKLLHAAGFTDAVVLPSEQHILPSLGIGITNLVERATAGARDLHDTVIQRLFAVGLSLQSVASTATVPRVADRLAAAISEIDDTIREVRSAIYALGMAGDDRGVRASVLALVRELTPVIGFEVKVTIDGPVDSTISDTVAHHLLATIREALTNVGRHAHASHARVVLSVADSTCRLLVVDDGIGLVGDGESGGGLGLSNLKRRAEKLGGTLSIETPEGGGTSLIWQVPLDP